MMVIQLRFEAEDQKTALFLQRSKVFPNNIWWSTTVLPGYEGGKGFGLLSNSQVPGADVENCAWGHLYDIHHIYQALLYRP